MQCWLHLHSFKTWPSCRDSHCATTCLASSWRMHDPHNSTPFMPTKLRCMGNAAKLHCQLGIDPHPLDPQLLPQPLYFFEAEPEETLLQVVVFKRGALQKNSQSRPPPFKWTCFFSVRSPVQDTASLPSRALRTSPFFSQRCLLNSHQSGPLGSAHSVPGIL